MQTISTAQAISAGQTISTAIRQERTRQAIEEGKAAYAAYAARAAQVAAIAEAIIRDGQPELHSDSTALCSHFKLRKGYLPADGGGMDAVEALVYTHAAGYVVRLWIYKPDFAVKVRDVILLLSGEEKGYDCWLDTTSDPDDGGRLFPHSGKYLMPGMKILSHCLLGR